MAIRLVYLNLIYLALVIPLATASSTIFDGTGIDENGMAHITFGQVVSGSKETRQITICPSIGQTPVTVSGPFFLTEDRQTTNNGCTQLTLEFTPGENSCDYWLHEGLLTIAGGTSQEWQTQLSGIGVRPPAWQTKQASSGWRYGGSLQLPEAPYSLSATRNNEYLAWVTSDDGDTTNGYQEYSLTGQGNFDSLTCAISTDLDVIDEQTQTFLEARGWQEGDGLGRITAISSGDDFFVGVQKNGYVLTHQPSNSTCNSAAPDSSAQDDFADLFRRQGFGGSPRTCSIPCLGPNAFDCSSSAECRSKCSTRTCNFDYPSKGEDIAVSATQNCLLVTDTFNSELNTLVFQKNDSSRLDREHFRVKETLDYTEKDPELLDVNNSNFSVTINKRSSTATVCSVMEDIEENICQPADCNEICHPSFRNASSVKFLNDSSREFLVTDLREQRLYLFNPAGEVLASWPESPQEMNLCGLSQVIRHPSRNEFALLYTDSNAIVLLEWNGSSFSEKTRFTANEFPGLSQPVSAVFIETDNEESNLHVAMRGSRQIARLQFTPVTEAFYRTRLPASLTPSEPFMPNTASGSCLTTPPSLMCTFGDSSLNNVCPSAFSLSAGAIAGIVSGGVAIILTPVVFLTAACILVSRSTSKTIQTEGMEMQSK
ncbi:hypothetical protein [Endozoicomonas arenosclerae]|uniref:hypothetical protein n=1 Tax=Endozoicomonas arenosclerae TaxID=1633495 RepID=UPI0007859151|nr:hypothetical protein [Endozoicomonas arenosclerae]